MTDGRCAIVAGDKRGYAVFDLGAGRLVVQRQNESAEPTTDEDWSAVRARILSGSSSRGE
jgi:hypothetical protein